MKKLILGWLLLCSVNVLEASSSQEGTLGEHGKTYSGVIIGCKPTDFTIVGKALPRRALSDMVLTDLTILRCSDDSSKSYKVVASEDSRIMETIEKEIKLSSSTYVNPATQLTPHFTVATHLAKGNATFKQGSVTVNLRIEDRQGNVIAEAKTSGSENSFFALIDKATKSLAYQMCKPETYYTISTSERTSTKVKPIENYRGISKALQSYEEDKDTYYIYIDAKNAKIVQYHVDAKSTRKLHKEAYKLNMQSCQYEIETKDELIKNMGGRNILKSEDAGWGFDDDTKIYVNLPSSQKDLSFTWGRLRKNGYYSKTTKYQKKIPQIVKNMMGKVNDMATLFRNESKNSKDMEIFKSLYDFPGTPKDVQCGGKVSMETLLIPPLDGFQDPDVAFKINIRPSTKGEIKILKNKMHIQ